MDAAIRKPRPVPTPDTAPFWAAVQRQELLVQRCTACGRHQFYPRSLCQRCWSVALEWVPSAGTGRIYSFTVVYRPPSPAFQPPYVVAVAELTEGVRMMANVVRCEPAAVHIDMPVRVVFVPHEDGLVPAFAPVAPSG